MQTFVRLQTGKTITIDFVNGVTTVLELKTAVLDREGLPENMIDITIIKNNDGNKIEDSHVLTRTEFGDKMFHFVVLV